MLSVQPDGAIGRDQSVVAAFEERISIAAGIANAAQAALVRLTIEALTAQMWEGDRVLTPQQWLTLKLGVAPSTAHKIVRLARRSDELPVTLDLVDQGLLSIDQATVIARYVPAAYEASVCDMAPSATVAQLIRATSRYDFDLDRADRDAKADRDQRPRGPRRQVTFGHTDSDEWTLRAVLPADEGALIEDALKDQRDKLHAAARANAASAPDGDASHADPPTWADTLVAMAKIAAASDTCGEQITDRVGALIHLRRPDPGHSDTWHAEMHTGPTLPAPLRRYLTCDCDIAVVWEHESTPVATARTQRIVPRRIRRLILQRDRTCRIPGCTRHLGLQIHHITHWEDGGETVTWNLLAVCGHHHRLHHQGWITITGNADATTGPDIIRVHTHSGQLLSPAPTTRAATPCQLPTAQPYKGPTGEPLHTRWVSFDRTRDGIDTTRARSHHPPEPRPQP